MTPDNRALWELVDEVDVAYVEAACNGTMSRQAWLRIKDLLGRPVSSVVGHTPVSDETVEVFVAIACRFKNDEIELVDELYPLFRCALDFERWKVVHANTAAEKVDVLERPVVVGDEMVELAARAMCDNNADDDSNMPWYREQAKVALESMVRGRS